jgi:DNA-binding CsgD family transcriptional regulator
MAKISQEKIFDLIGSLYENAQKTSTEAWTIVYREMADLFSSGPGSLTIYSTIDNQFQKAVGTIGEDLLTDYFTKYQEADPFREFVAGMGEGDSFNRRDLISDDDFRQTDIYRSFFSKAGMFHIQYFVFMVQDGIHGGVSFSRAESERNFNADERAAMAFVMPHLARAFQLYLQLHDTRRENKMMAEAFNRIPQSVMILDAGHRLIFANNSGKEILNDADGLDTDRSGRISASHGPDDRRLHSVLDTVLSAGGHSESSDHAGVVQISRPSGRRAIEVLVVPFSEEYLHGLDPQPMVILFVSNQEQKLQNIDAMLRRMYGLTTAEARVASMLTDGQTLSEVCEMLNIKQNTARTHLKHIFSKTETNRQSELVTLILNGPGRLREFRSSDGFGTMQDKPKE